MDLNNLPKEALFSLFLQIEPEEIKTICLSKNPKIRQVCNSLYFQETYNKKYPKFKLILFDNDPPLIPIHKRIKLYKYESKWI